MWRPITYFFTRRYLMFTRDIVTTVTFCETIYHKQGWVHFNKFQKSKIFGQFWYPKSTEIPRNHFRVRKKYVKEYFKILLNSSLCLLFSLRLKFIFTLLFVPWHTHFHHHLRQENWLVAQCSLRANHFVRNTSSPYVGLRVLHTHILVVLDVLML